VKRAVLYLRLSTIDQTTANQERELRQAAERAGWQVTKVYHDHGISSAKGRDKRPAFDALHKAAARREFDLVMAWSVDRLGRSLQDLVAFLSELHALKVDLFLHQQGLDTTTPAGKAMFQMLGVFAEFERSIIQERVRAGLARAKGEGKVLGRPERHQGHAGRRHGHTDGRQDARRRRRNGAADRAGNGTRLLPWLLASETTQASAILPALVRI
jgi:DNA invertase Pin-like site-specific DNA recombinase